MFRNRVKSSFTLLEITVCLVLLSIAALPLLINGKKLWEFHHMRTSVEKFHLALLQARSLAMSYQSSFFVSLTRTAKGIAIQIHSDEPAEEKKHRDILVSEGLNINFNNEKRDVLKVEILPSGAIEPAGKVIFQAKNGNQAFFVDWSKPFLLFQGEEKNEINQ